MQVVLKDPAMLLGSPVSLSTSAFWWDSGPGPHPVPTLTVQDLAYTLGSHGSAEGLLTLRGPGKHQYGTHRC